MTTQGIQTPDFRPGKRAGRRSLTIGLSLSLSVLLPLPSDAIAGQATTGKIIIDGVVYDGSDARIEQGSGVLGKERRDVGPFRAIHVAAGIDINYRNGPAQSIEIIGDRNLIPIIETSVSGGLLTIAGRKSYQQHLPLTVEITSPRLDTLALHGAGDIRLTALRQESLALTLNGSGNVIADGQIDRFSVTVNGAGDIDAQKLFSQQADIKLSGSGNITVTAQETLKAYLIGSGDITYYGRPALIEKRIIGSGDLQPGD
ncbi:head GIN domain-containing protein [Methylotuvimicrobium buryatense]|uniref:DUF2807 domain-containing protein n=1 Tax=Methylotuvimicrobium buryatense TaxID=95641 RepID=A0A4P9UI98_METBY|nr:head GIN domain-containing protein [Methylotuvimicrobium buryatense]QCW80839.1 DUF2807 domain-containing protein [Methylotuvimicrobium buryatense]